MSKANDARYRSTTASGKATTTAIEAETAPPAPANAAPIAKETLTTFEKPQLPPLPSASGLFVRKKAQPFAPIDELRLDVDGWYPQMAASGVLREPVSFRSLHWVAKLTAAGPRTWQGNIVFTDGEANLLPHNLVQISVTRGPTDLPQSAEVTFSGNGPASVQQYTYAGSTFDPVEFEFDATADAHPVSDIQTYAHPNHPADLLNETLTIASVYRRAGFNVTINGAGNIVPIAGAGVDGVWSDTEMHDAMQANWSRFADRAQWALWVFTAALHEEGNDLGGIMFDSSGPNQRQGTSIFSESFIKDAPQNDPAPVAQVARMRFWTTVHEMGHAFNLAHSWQESLGTPWIPLQNEPEGRTFMNYPYRVNGGQTAFFADFGYRFSDQELLFMRHAPRRFVQMGNADWFDNHGFRNAATSMEPSLRLELRVNRDAATFEFLEPVMIELKVTNISGQPMLVDRHLLSNLDRLTLVVKKDNQPARRWRPFANHCLRSVKRVLEAGQSLYEPLFAATGLDGWLIAEPGRYTLQSCLRLEDGEDVVSPPLRLKVLPPRGHEEELLAQDLLTDSVGRVLAFDGTRETVLQDANSTLREATERLPDSSIAVHAAVALAMPLRRSGKILVGTAARSERVAAVSPQPTEARKLLEGTLVAQGDAAAKTLGHIDYRYYTETLARMLADAGDAPAARNVATSLETTLARRKVKPAVLQEVRTFATTLGAPGGTGR
jgi:reprolysin-like metallo-peptidase family M12B